MIRINSLILLVLFTAFLSVQLLAQNHENVYSTKQGRISIKSDAPLELIEASSGELKGVIDTNKKNFSFSVQNRSFKGFNSPLQQEHFYENYIEANKFPVSTFKGKIIEQIDLMVDGNYQVRAKGLLNIHGVEQERIIKVDITVKNGTIKGSSTFLVPLTDHNITIPKIVYQKIAEEVMVTVDASFNRELK